MLLMLVTCKECCVQGRFFGQYVNVSFLNTEFIWLYNYLNTFDLSENLIMRIAILYKVQDYYVTILRYCNEEMLRYDGENKLIYSRFDADENGNIINELFEYKGIRKASSLWKVYKKLNIDGHIVFAEYNLISIIFYPLLFWHVKYKAKSLISDYRLDCRVRLISLISKENCTLKDYLYAYSKYIIHDHYTLWIYNELTECFTFVSGSITPDKQYVGLDEGTSLNVVLEKDFQFEMRSPEESEIVHFKEKGMNSLTRISLQLGPHKQPAALSFYSFLNNFKIQDQVVKDIKSLVEMKYPEQLYGLSMSLEAVTHELDLNRSEEIDDYMHILTKNLCEKLEYEAASVFIVDEDTDDMRLISSYDMDSKGAPKESVIYPKGKDSLTNQVRSDISRCIVVYDLGEVNPNSHIYDEKTENPATNWIGVPIGFEDKALAVIRVKNKFIIDKNGSKEIVAPRPSDHFNLMALSNIVEGHLINTLQIADFDKKLKLHDNLSKVYRHEIRGPISSIVEIPNELIDVLKDGEASKGDIDKVIKGLKDLESLTQNLAYIAKSYNVEKLISDDDAGASKLSLLGDLIIPIEKLTKNYYKTKYDSNIVIDHNSMRGASVLGKRELYSMVLYALLDNAGKYQLMETGDIKIYSDYKSTDKKISLYIENYGLEIFDSERDNIFHNDGRGELAIEYKIDGSGIGLWLCSRIMKKYNGDIKLDSRFNPVRFKLTFPRGDI